MFTYEQKTGQLKTHTGELLYTGYSGYREGKNNPAFQSVPNVGPIPQGEYAISGPFDSPEHGPFCLRLTWVSGPHTFGRDGFLMHGDSKEHPGEASRGCIIMPRFVREAVKNSGDGRLRVTA